MLNHRLLLAAALDWDPSYMGIPCLEADGVTYSPKDTAD